MRLGYPLGEFARDNDRPAGLFRRRRRNGDTRRNRRHLCRHRRGGLLRLAGDDSRLVPAVALSRRRNLGFVGDGWCRRRRSSLWPAITAHPAALFRDSLGCRLRRLRQPSRRATEPTTDSGCRSAVQAEPGVRAGGGNRGPVKSTGAAATLGDAGSGNFPRYPTHLVVGNFGQAIVGNVNRPARQARQSHCGGCS